jgi:hypothetical protein
MSNPTKSAALKAVESYSEILKNISVFLNESSESRAFWAKELGLSDSAVSNKKAGRRAWKINEVKAILEVLKKDTKIVDDYIEILDNIDKMIAERGFKKLFFYHKIGLSNMQIYTRRDSVEKGYFSWQIDEIKKLVEAL